MHTNKTKFIVGLAVLILSAGVVFAGQAMKKNSSTKATLQQQVQSTSTTAGTANTTNITKTKAITTTSYTIAQVATHNTSSDCWTIVNGNVYNVTSWISKHPGGSQAIIGLCGIDGSALFNDQHGGQSRPEAELASFKIGIFKK